MAWFDVFRLDGKRACVTGGSRGLGLAMARGLAEAGADLVLIGREEAALDEARGQLAALGRRVEVVSADVGQPLASEDAAVRVVEQSSPIDILINNVGGRRIDVPTEELPTDQWQRIIDLNLTSAFIWSKVVGGSMLARGWGRVINVASMSGLIANRGITGRSYETAKAALISFTRALAADWASRGVTVNAIAPGYFATEPNRLWFEARPQLEDTVLSMIPMGRLGQPEELAPLAVYLASACYSNTRETETGYTAEEAVIQARRCLQCQLNIMIDPSICILCSGCVDICPYDCISMEGLSRVVKGDLMHQGTETWRGGADMIIDEEKCIRCGLCIVRCPTDAISMVQFEVASPNDRWTVSKIPVLNINR